MKSVLVIAQSVAGRVSPASLGLLSLARSLTRGAVTAFSLDPTPALLEALARHGAGAVLAPGEALDAGAAGDTHVAWLRHAARHVDADLVLFGHTAFGLDLAPRLAFRMGGMVVTGCSSIDVGDDGALRYTHLCHGGNAREQVRLRARPAVATVRAGFYRAVEHASPSAALQALAAPDELQGRAGAVPAMRVVARETTAADQQRLEDARVIVAGGRGVEGPEGFAPLAQLARRLGGVVGASRVPCDLGWVPHSMQIGLSGRTVTPDLYFAVGISGASHHLAGCGGARTLVAINNDAQAAIFRHARFGIVGDHKSIVPALIEALGRTIDESTDESTHKSTSGSTNPAPSERPPYAGAN